MLDGAPSLNDPRLQHFIWMTPQEIFEKHRLPAEINRRLRPIRFELPAVPSPIEQFTLLKK